MFAYHLHSTESSNEIAQQSSGRSQDVPIQVRMIQIIGNVVSISEHDARVCVRLDIIHLRN